MNILWFLNNGNQGLSIQTIDYICIIFAAVIFIMGVAQCITKKVYFRKINDMDSAGIRKFALINGLCYIIAAIGIVITCLSGGLGILPKQLNMPGYFIWIFTMIYDNHISNKARQQNF